MFLQASVILSTGRGGVVCLSACWDTTPPLGADTPPPEQTPREQTPPGSRHPQEQKPPQSRHPPRADTPLWEQTPPPEQTLPPGADTPPYGKQTPAYGQRAAGTHRTGMHSCSWDSFTLTAKVTVFASGTSDPFLDVMSKSTIEPHSIRFKR